MVIKFNRILTDSPVTVATYVLEVLGLREYLDSIK